MFAAIILTVFVLATARLAQVVRQDVATAIERRRTVAYLRWVCNS